MIETLYHKEQNYAAAKYLIAQHCNNRDFMLNNLLNRTEAFPKINTGTMEKLTAFNIHAQQLRPYERIRPRKM